MKNNSEMDSKQYRHLLFMVILSFVSMYIFMYSMVDRIANVVPNINQIYMAGLMTSPHHAAVILMVEQAKLSDPEIKQLDDEIISFQRKGSIS